jgi:hypothetical protein
MAGPRFSHDELVAILQESVATEGEHPERRYSTDDLTAAARELGLDAERVRAVAERQLARRDAKSVSRRPFDSRIQVHKEGGVLQLRIPPLPPRAANLAPLGFALFWLAFISFWTWGAAHAGALFGAFSIPFWLVGLGMLGRFGLPLLRTTTLEIGPDGATLTTAPLGKARRLRREELKVRVGENVRFRHAGMRVQQAAAPAVLLEHGTETIALLDGYSEQEQRWVVEELGAWLHLD